MMHHQHAISTTDPITGHDLHDLEKHPFIVEGSHYNDVTIYFESEDTKRAYQDTLTTRVGGEGRLHSLLDNPAADMNDNN